MLRMTIGKVPQVDTPRTMAKRLLLRLLGIAEGESNGMVEHLIDYIIEAAVEAAHPKKCADTPASLPARPLGADNPHAGAEAPSTLVFGGCPSCGRVDCTAMECAYKASGAFQGFRDLAQAPASPSADKEVDLIARGLGWEECEALMKEACDQAGVQWDAEERPQSIAINVMQRLANDAHKVGFKLGLERMASARTPADSVREDAEVGRIAMRFVDRAGDPHPGIDDAETICREFYAAISEILNPRFQRRLDAALKQGDIDCTGGSPCSTCPDPKKCAYGCVRQGGA